MVKQGRPLYAKIISPNQSPVDTINTSCYNQHYRGDTMKRIYIGWYEDTHLGETTITGTDTQQMADEAYEIFAGLAQQQGLRDTDTNLSITYRTPDCVSSF